MERQRILKEWNRTERDYPRQTTIHRLFESQASANPDKIVARCGPRTFTYAQLDARANALAARLASEGVRPGVLVGLCVERSLDMVAGVLGILKVGAAYVPMDPTYPAERLQMILEDGAMPVIVIQSALAGRLPEHGAKLLMMEDLPAETTLIEPGHAATADGLAYVMFTSGSTGRPKGVQIPHRAVVNFLNSMRREPGLSPDDVLLAVTTLSFDIAGLELLLPLTAGATVAIAPQECLVDGNLLKRELDRVGATVMQATPATWRLLLEAGWTGNPKLKILIGGEAVPRELVNRLLPCCGSLWNVYGPTETTIWSTTVRLGPGEEPVSIGRPIDNTQVYIVSPSLQLQPVGVPGELLIGGDGLALGYHQRPDWTAERFMTDPFRNRRGARVYRTGDLAKWRSDGTIECLGRMDNQVKIRGYRIELGEIEAALARHAGVKESVVIAREDRPGQKHLVAYFVPAGSAGPAATELREHVAASLPDYMVPVQFMPLEKLPLTPNGKVNRRGLPFAEETAPVVAKSALQPRTAPERTLANIWKEILRRECISVDDDIFDLGGDSILIFQITSRANEAGLAITPAQVFRHRTIATLAALNEPSGGGAQSTSSGGPIARVDRAAFRKK